MAHLPVVAEGTKLVLAMTKSVLEEGIRTSIFEFSKGVSLQSIVVSSGQGLLVSLILKGGVWVIREVTKTKLSDAEIAGAVVIGSILTPFVATGMLISATVDALLPKSNENDSDSWTSSKNESPDWYDDLLNKLSV